jgi:hypothetical protein
MKRFLHKMDTTGKETVLYSFCSLTNCADGAQPLVGLIRDSAGNLYGTTWAVAFSEWERFSRWPRSGAENVLHSFVGAARLQMLVQP